MSAKKETLKLSREDAARVILVRTLECDVPPQDWNAAMSDQAGADARQLAGDKASPAAWLLARTKLLLTRFKVKDTHAVDVALNRDWLGKTLLLFVFALAIAGYLAGAFSDRLSSTGSRINLLAPPLLGLIVWNAAVYVLLLIQGVLSTLGIRFELPLQKGFLKLTHWLGAARMPGRAVNRAFFKAWLPLRADGLKHRIRRACHIAALAFAVGILTSIAIRGIGTAYVVGWESTWFSGRADIVTPVIHIFYGLIPWALPGTAPLPDESAVAALEWVAGAVPAAGESAAPWLWRLIQTVFWWVLLPRLVLIVWESFTLRLGERTVRLDLSDPYYRSIFSVLNQKRATHFMVDASLITPESRWQLRDNLPLGLSREVSSVHFWDTEDQSLLDEWAQRARVIPVFNAIHTPESDVHGIWLDRLAERMPAGFPVGVDFAEFDARFGDDETKRGGRLALWEQFISEHHGRTIFISESLTGEALGEALLQNTPSEASGT